jgi:hypothetical protein
MRTDGIARRLTAMAGWLASAIHAMAICLGAFLLFQIQPMFAKRILPWFGGSAAVWITCMLFFQSGLLGGYLYAHASVRWLTPRSQTIVHAGLLVASLALLPVGPAAGWKPLGSEEPILRILGLLSASIGLPYLLLAATSPLLQAWYARTFRAALPYRLFALSNLASLIGLLAYPFAIEPQATLSQQAALWSAGYGLFVLLVLIAALLRARTAEGGATLRARAAGDPGRAQGAACSAPTAGARWMWLLFAGCGSLLLMSVTNHLTQNVTSLPFLWVVPLGLYLFSYVLCFDFQHIYRRPAYLWLSAAAIGVMAFGLPVWGESGLSLRLVIPAYALGMFLCCMFCHGELAQRKPDPRHLTVFYLMISAGGALGGVLVGIVAPLTLPGYSDLPIALCACALLLLSVHWRAGLVPKVLSLCVVAGVGMASAQYIHLYTRYARVMVRDFYGDLVVTESDKGTTHEYRSLLHGTVIHGTQYTSPELRRTPTSYFSPASGIGLAFSHLGHTPLRVGIVGLGAGALAAYAKPGDTFRFYEINPRVAHLAWSEFTYLSDCLGTCEVVLGDGRISLEREASQSYDLLVFDAFSGDAIPSHLLTIQAMELYWRHLKPTGILAVNISNSYIDLSSVVAGLCAVLGKHATFIPSKGLDEYPVYDAEWILIASRPLESEALKSAARPLGSKPVTRLWTDDYSNLLQVLR